MSAPAGPLAFFLDFAEAEGGVAEPGLDATLVLLPTALQAELDLPEEVNVTSEAEVAREDGALLLVHGHPVVDRVARTILGRGDAGHARLPWPAPRPPSAADLVERAREDLQVDHGRIEPAGPPPVESYLPALRVGALVTYATSLEDRFQEREEVWLDAASTLELEPSLRARLLDRHLEPGVDPVRPFLRHDLTSALVAADSLIAQRARHRRQELTRQSSSQREQELSRATAYYEATLSSIAHRLATAPPDRREILAAQAEITAVERDRRLAEIQERFEPRHEVKPYRLHLVGVPALRLGVHVRRGQRTFPLQLTWVLGGGGFVPMRCPHCAGRDVLVAGRDRLGCRGCLPRPVELAAGVAGNTPPAPPPSELMHRRSPDPPASPSPPPTRKRSPLPRPATTAPAVDPQRLERAGDKLARGFWTTAARGDRWRGKVTVPHSPMAALSRLYGAPGALRAIGVPEDVQPYNLTVSGTEVYKSGIHATSGLILTYSGNFPYLLRWDSFQGSSRIGEVLPHRSPNGRLAPRGALPSGVESLLMRPPPPRAAPEGRAGGVWAQALHLHGLSFALRCLATWWRIQDASGMDAFDEEPLTAAILEIAQSRAGLDPSGPAQPELWAAEPAAIEAATGFIRRIVGPAKDQPW